MLPQSLTSIYQQYKHDTNVVASWLATTGQGCGYQDLSKPTEATVGPSKRLKGKARKAAQAAKITPLKGTGVSEQAPPKHVLAIKDFVPLAQCIAAATKPAVKVPSFFATAIGRVIEARRSFAVFYEQQEKSSDQLSKSNAKHSFFLSVLEQVREILKPRMPADVFNISAMLEALGKNHVSPDGSPSPAEPSSDGRNNNKFDILKVYEPSAEFLAAPGAQPSIMEPVYQPEGEDTFEDAFFAFTILLQEMLQLRAQVRELWHNYAAGTIHLTAVAIASNTAVQLARAMEADLEPLMRRHGGVEELLGMYYAGVCLAIGKDPAGRARPDDAISMACYDEAEHFMFTAYLFIDAFRRACPYEPNMMPGYNGRFGWYDETMDLNIATDRQKFSQDQCAFFEILPELVAVHRLSKQNDCEDEFMRGVKMMYKEYIDHNIPLWLCLAGSIYIDTLRELHGQLDKSFTQVINFGRTVENAITAAMEARGRLKAPTWPPQLDLYLKDTARLATFWEKDPIYTLKASHGESPKPNALLRRHPLFCGLSMHYISCAFHKLGVDFANAWGSVLYTYQFYHALQHESLLDKENDRWDDLDILYSSQGRQGFFVGDPPGDGESYFSNFCICMGSSASNWAGNRRKPGKPGKPVLSKAGPRGMQLLGPVSMLFRERFGADGPRGMLTVSDVQQILDKSQWMQVRQEDGKMLLEKADNSRDTKRKGTATSQSQGDDNHTKLVSPSQLIKSLCLALHAEVVDITFDYFTLHRYCFSTLSIVRQCLDSQLSSYFGPEYLENDTQLPFVVGYLFMALVGRVDLLESGCPRELLARSAPLVARVLERGSGRVVRDRMEKFGVRVEIRDGEGL